MDFSQLIIIGLNSRGYPGGCISLRTNGYSVINTGERFKPKVYSGKVLQGKRQTYSGKDTGQIVRKIIVYSLLASLPKAYKSEAQMIFRESCDGTDIKEALAYFEGGILYRFRSLLKQLM